MNDVAGILMRNRRARLQNCRANHPELPSLSGDRGPRAGVDAGEAGQMADVVRGRHGGDIPGPDRCQGLGGEDRVGVEGMRVGGWHPGAANGGPRAQPPGAAIGRPRREPSKPVEKVVESDGSPARRADPDELASDFVVDNLGDDDQHTGQLDRRPGARRGRRRQPGFPRAWLARPRGSLSRKTRRVTQCVSPKPRKTSSQISSVSVASVMFFEGRRA